LIDRKPPNEVVYVRDELFFGMLYSLSPVKKIFRKRKFPDDPSMELPLQDHALRCQALMPERDYHQQ
jgi:hypothetical protein